jgi:hypothetical protein
MCAISAIISLKDPSRTEQIGQEIRQRDICHIWEQPSRTCTNHLESTSRSERLGSHYVYTLWE